MTDADGAAWVIAGVVASGGSDPGELTAEELRERVGWEIGLSSRWVPGPLTGDTATERFLLDAMQPLARWTAPAPEAVAAVVSHLGGAAVDLLTNPAPGWARPVLRLAVGSLDDAATLRRRESVAGIRLVPHVSWGAARQVWWRWPLRVGVVAAEQAAALTGGLGDLFSVVDVGGEVEVELLVLPDGGAAVPDGVRAACVVVPGGDEPSLERIAPAGPAAVVLTESADLSWFPWLIAELAHDQPLDVAVALACPESSLLADEMFLPLTSVRVWALRLADDLERLGLDPSELRALVADGLFDMERRGSTALADRVRAIDTARGEATVVRAAVPLAEASPPEEESDRHEGQPAGADAPGAAPPPPPPAPPPPPPSPSPTRPSARPPRPAPSRPPVVDEDGPGEPGASPGGPPPPGAWPPGPMAEAAPEVIAEAAPEGFAEAAPMEEGERGGGEGAEEPGPDRRRLQAQVLDPATRQPVPDRFLAGTVNHVRVRVAREVQAGAVAADAVFANPTPGREAELVVEIIAGETHAKRTLDLPAVADSKWTRAVPFEVPEGRERFEVFVQVWFSGRVVQSAVLSGPVLPGDAPAPAGGDGLRLSVDSSTPPAAIHDMSGAGASFTIVPGLEGEPLVLDLAQARAISPEGLARATAKLRATLLAAFLAPPASLEGAAGPLARLALAGSPLYRQLRADAYDAAEWVHVSSFGGADLPVELVYTHPMPDDEEVPVCPTALAGATECAAGCPDRARSDCVCPYGFWATSKVIERRAHTGDRTAATAGSQRAVDLLAVGAAGVSVKADEVDPTSSQRILDAVRSATAAGGFHPVSSWADLKPVASLPARLLVLITHTVPGDDPKLQLGSDVLDVDRIDLPYVNPGRAEPGPVVLAIGCDTEAVETGFADYVGLLFGAGAELVVSAISPVPGKSVADFVVRFFRLLPEYLAQPGIHRFGEVLTAARRQTVAAGDVLGLALTASGDADVALVGS